MKSRLPILSPYLLWLHYSRIYPISYLTFFFTCPFFDLRIDAMLLFRLIRYLTLSDFTVDVHAADRGKSDCWRSKAGNVAINKILRVQGKDQRRGGLPHELSDQVFFFLSQAAGRVWSSRTCSVTASFMRQSIDSEAEKEEFWSPCG